MRKDPISAKDSPTWRPLRLFVWVALASLLCGLVNFGEILEDQLRVARNSLHSSKASGDIVMVGIDNASLRELGEWPWPRARYARMVDAATRGGASGIFLDSFHEAPGIAADDKAFAEALRKSGRVTMPVRARLGTKGGERYDGMPNERFRKHVRLANITVFYNYQHSVWKIHYSADVQGRTYPAFSAALAGERKTDGYYRVDYSIDPASIPYVSAKDLLSGKVAPDLMKGRQVLIASNAEKAADDYWIPGHGRMSGAYIHALGAETLKEGRQLDLGFWPAWLLSLVMVGLALFRASATNRIVLLAGTVVVLLAGQFLAEAHLVFVDTVPALLALAVVGGRLGWLRWRSEGLVNDLSGLPNLNALRNEANSAGLALVAARIHNYAEIASTLESKDEAILVAQLVHRLSVSGGPKLKVFQGDEGVFAWLADPSAPLANHLEALHALFRSPLSVGGRPIDVALSFGVEMGSTRALGNRLGSALVAADEAWSEGLKWKYHDPARQEEVGWRLSLLGQLDAAIDNGEVWVAYQPQLDLRTRQIVGAEALARWTHPEKGPISPTEFVAAAEQQGRIGKLTAFVMERAVATAAAINRRGADFTIAVNISARMLNDREVLDLVRVTLAKHKLRPDRLTLELTETEALRSAGAAIAVLETLRSMGVRVAIDDYGTGLSTLDYLKKVPANEIKIDQSFVKAMRVNHSDLIMVQSTIALAHSLGRTVVAEGVEDRPLLERLIEMDCDVAQGFAIGRPMGVRELVQRLQVGGQRRVA